ncbi:MAG: D-glycero-beta-D-manno-heptose 1,7-bisphosphate 7-phosphatase [Gammaproteobacteria bacterium]|nr:D-glycero-beta-D-manno-heptose 1,7-bisphosphate 7-phosphatase [Gammaproteobacteria bacterium]
MKLIILDMDGVINQDSDDFIKTEQEWEAIPGSLQAIARLNHSGFHVVTASNQSGLARGKLTMHDLNRIHRKLHTHLAQYGGVIDAIFFCPHGPDEGCACRKPEPGLLREIESRLHTPLYGVPVIGDRLTDVQAAQTVGARPMLVRTGKGQKQLDEGLIPEDVPVHDDLAQATSALLDTPGAG